MNNLSVMIVDADEERIALLLDLLESAGTKCSALSSWHTARESLGRQILPDLLLISCDILSQNAQTLIEIDHLLSEHPLIGALVHTRAQLKAAEAISHKRTIIHSKSNLQREKPNAFQKRN